MRDEFNLLFKGTPNPDNLRVTMAFFIPWTEVESDYIKHLGNPNEKSKAYPVRLALGSLIIKKMGLSDEKTVAITENPYL